MFLTLEELLLKTVTVSLKTGEKCKVKNHINLSTIRNHSYLDFIFKFTIDIVLCIYK